MPGETKRVNFYAPEELVERADALGDVLGESRTDLLVTALRDQLDDLLSQESIERGVKEAFFAGEMERERVETLLGTEEAARLGALRDALGEGPTPAAPERVETVPAEEFYDGPVPEVVPESPLDGEGGSRASGEGPESTDGDSG